MRLIWVSFLGDPKSQVMYSFVTSVRAGDDQYERTRLSTVFRMSFGPGPGLVPAMARALNSVLRWEVMATAGSLALIAIVLAAPLLG